MNEKELQRYDNFAKTIDGLAVLLSLWRPELILFAMAQFIVRRWPFAVEGILDVFHIERISAWVVIVFPGASKLIETEPAKAQKRSNVAPPSGPSDDDDEPPMRIQRAPAEAPVLRLSSAGEQPRVARPTWQAWFERVQDHPQHLPHAFVMGPPGSGKSALMEALARTREGPVFVIQPNRQLGEWDGVPVVQCDDDGGYAEITLALKAWEAEFKRRGGAMKQGDPGPWITLIWDEIPLCIRQLGDFAANIVFNTISAGRPRKMRLLGGSTNHRVGAVGLDGYGDLLDGVAIIHLRDFAVADCPELVNNPWPTSLTLNGKPEAVERGPVPTLMSKTIDPDRIWRPGVESTEGSTDHSRYRRCADCSEWLSSKQWGAGKRWGCPHCGGNIE